MFENDGTPSTEKGVVRQVEPTEHIEWDLENGIAQLHRPEGAEEEKLIS